MFGVPVPQGSSNNSHSIEGFAITTGEETKRGSAKLINDKIVAGGVRMNVDMESSTGEIVIFKNNFDIIEGGVDKVFDPKSVLAKQQSFDSSLNI